MKGNTKDPSARSALGLGLAVLLLLQGCASYTAHPAPIPSIETMPVSRTVGSVTVAADPYLSKDRREAVFGAISGAVLPIHVFVQNDGLEPLSVRYTAFAVEGPDGWVLPDGGPRAAYQSGMRGAFDGRLADMLQTPILGAPVFAAVAVLLPVLLPMGIIDEVHNAKIRHAAADYRAKEFQDVILEAGEAAHGFVYFVFPSGVPALGELVLVVHPGDSEGDRTPLEIRLPLGLPAGRLADDPPTETPR